ncbi:carbohydrate kinase, YjeF related protein [Mycobacteroides abscessus subsp. abscessus]|nr:carbohydrate kinase, YjeF related protein [Mycobacteroides abscessus subsp. abscessus]
MTALENLARYWPAPTERDHKYTRGVVCMATGSEHYPGAALIGCEAAARCGVGMVRYAGPEAVARMVIARTPEVVPATGRAQVFVAGSGWEGPDRLEAVRACMRETSPGALLVADAGALGSAGLVTGSDASPVRTVLTPHAGEAAHLLEGWDRARIETSPREAAETLAVVTGATVILKGHTTWIAAPGEDTLAATSPTTRLATAGTGDALAGITGALLALNHAQIAQGLERGDRRTLLAVCEAAVTLHAHAAALAAGEGHAPILASDIAQVIPDLFARLSSKVNT